MARKKGFLESRGFKIFMKYLYGLGAAVVIGGALFKIMHWPGANQMLIAGMGTEVLVFFVSAFEPLHEEHDWTRVYPELAADEGEFLPEEDDDEDYVDPKAHLLEVKDKMAEMQITPEIFDGLKGSLTGLKDNVDKLSQIQDATVATNEYATNAKQAADKMGALNDSYNNTVDAMNSLSSSVGSAAEQAESYHNEVQKVTKNLSSLNAVYEMELADANAHVKTLNQFYESMGNAMSNMVDASKDAETYRQEVAKLTQNLRDLNRIYGGMLTAMGGPGGGNA